MTELELNRINEHVGKMEAYVKDNPEAIFTSHGVLMLITALRASMKREEGLRGALDMLAAEAQQLSGHACGILGGFSMGVASVPNSIVQSNLEFSVPRVQRAIVIARTALEQSHE